MDLSSPNRLFSWLIPGLLISVAPILSGSLSSALPVLAPLPTHSASKVEADRLLLQGIEEYEGQGKAKALQSWQQALEIYRQIKDRIGEENALSNIGIFYYDQGESLKAVDYHQQSLAIAREIKDRLGEAIALGNISSAYTFLISAMLSSCDQSCHKQSDIYNQQYDALSPELKTISPDRPIDMSVRKAAESYAASPHTPKLKADQLLEQGIEEYEGQGEKALQSWQQALEIYRQIKDRLGEEDALDNIGLVYASRHKHREAVDYYQQSLAIAQEIKDRLGEGIALGNISLAYNFLIIEPNTCNSSCFRQGKYYVQQYFAIANELPTFSIGKLTARTVRRVAQVAQSPNRRKAQADRLLQRWTTAQQDNLYSILQGQSSSTIKFARDTKFASFATEFDTKFAKEREKVITTLQKALEIYRQIKDRKGEEDALFSLGYAYLRGLTSGLTSPHESLIKAIDYLQKSLAIARELKNPSDVDMSLGFLSNTYGTLSEYYYYGYHNSHRDFSKAIDYGLQELAIQRELKNRADEGETLHSLGQYYYHRGEYSKAIDYLQQSLAIAREIKYESLESQSLSSLGTTYRLLGEYSKAIDYLQQSLAIDRKQEQNVSNLTHATVPDYLLENQYTGATLSELGVALEGTGRLSEAERTLLEAITIWDALLDKRSDGPLHQGDEDAVKLARNIDNIDVLDAHSSTYRSLQRVLVAQNKIEPALEIAERGRARALVDLLTSRIQSKNTSSTVIPPISLSEIKQVAKAQNATLVEYSFIEDMSNTLLDFPLSGWFEKVHESALYVWVVQPNGDINFRKVDLKSLLQPQNISLRDKVAQARQSIIKGVNVAFRGNNITLTPGDRIKLNDDDPDWEAWQVVSVDVKNSKITIRLPSWEADKPAIECPIADVLKKIGINSSSANAKNSQLQEFYQLLIQPIADLLPKEETARVIFIPQDALFLVPFPALQDPSGQYLIDKHTILTAPSIQVLDSTHKLRQKVPGLAKDILVVGNPTMPKVSLKPGEPPKQLSALPGSEKEALAIASLWKTRALIGNQATKNAVLQKLPLAKIIHLATHGLLDDIQGLGSSIVFAPEGQDNGLLTADEIYNLYAPQQRSLLSAELVILSACDTGQGRLTGDGVIGLSRSIIAAGVPSVIVSLWSIPDAPTAELMTEFYENFRKNPDKAAALRQAMLTTKKKHLNPAEWAAFTLIGESE